MILKKTYDKKGWLNNPCPFYHGDIKVGSYRCSKCDFNRSFQFNLPEDEIECNKEKTEAVR